MVAQAWMDETCLYGKAADLRRVPLFADLEDEAIVGVAAVSHGRVHTRGAWLVEACGYLLKKRGPGRQGRRGGVAGGRLKHDAEGLPWN